MIVPDRKKLKSRNFRVPQFFVRCRRTYVLKKTCTDFNPKLDPQEVEYVVFRIKWLYVHTITIEKTEASPPLFLRRAV